MSARDKAEQLEEEMRKIKLETPAPTSEFEEEAPTTRRRLQVRQDDDKVIKTKIFDAEIGAEVEDQTEEETLTLQLTETELTREPSPLVQSLSSLIAKTTLQQTASQQTTTTEGVKKSTKEEISPRGGF